MKDAILQPSGQLQNMKGLLRRWNGPYTQLLRQTPGHLGLGQVPERLRPDGTTGAVCGFCSTGCGLRIHHRNGVAVNVSPDTLYPVNKGMACPKGWEALTPLYSEDRALAPRLRDSDGRLQTVSWNEALETMVSRFRSIQAAFGPESIAFLSTGQMMTEEMALLGALAKFGMGIRHCDSNTRQCMATAATAYKESFGFDAPPYTYSDLEESDVLVFVGANPCIAHPILWQRVLGNPNRPEILVVDPRKTETASAATRHYAIQPKSDLVLFYGLANLLIQEGWVDQEFVREHTSFFEAFVDHVSEFSLERITDATGLCEDEVRSMASLLRPGKRVSYWWTMGVNQSHEGTRVAQAIINLALMTGQIGKPGTGANSITGQCNAMGSRLFSNITNLLGGHEFESPEHRRKVADELGLDEQRIPRKKSWAYDQILDGIDRGEIRGLWIVATNTAHSWIHQGRCRDRLSRLDFLVVQDLYDTTETARMAGLILPAAGWGEKDGTFINSERRVGVCRKVKSPPGQAMSDFNIFRSVARAWGCSDLFKEWESPEATFQILKRLSRGQPCDITGIRGYEMIENAGGIQWPYPENSIATATERRLFEEGRFFFEDGRARFIFSEPREPDESPDSEYPFWLLTGRGTSAQWHTQTRTSKSAVLRQLYPRQIYIEIHPTDAAALSVARYERVQVTSRRGELEARAFVTAGVAPGQVFIPMHYEETNRLTCSAFDPHSRQPSYKACAVKLRKAGDDEHEIKRSGRAAMARD